MATLANTIRGVKMRRARQRCARPKPNRCEECRRLIYGDQTLCSDCLSLYFVDWGAVFYRRRE